MHARELIELAGLVSAHGPLLVESDQRLAKENIEQYWVTSKARLDRWAHSLKGFAGPLDASSGKLSWRRVRGVLEEILASEVLTRVWTAVLCAHDRRLGTDDAGPVARSVMLGHIEARHRVLTLVVHTPRVEVEAAVKLNSLRRRAERWTDVLVGRLAETHEVAEFAADPARAKDFAEELRCRGAAERRRLTWPLMMASLRGAFQRGMDGPSANADLNARIAASIIACFPAELFSGTGLFYSVWMMNLMTVADDAQGMIDELLSPRGTAVPSDRPFCARNPRLRRFGA
jgi:hypothetical protein